MRFVTVLLVFSVGYWAHGGILSTDFQTLDFTKVSNEDPRITFEPADKLTLNKDGLGWDGDTQGSYDGSFTTAPIPTGTAWRPTTWVTLTATIRPASQVFQKGMWRGALFVRYSPDKKHWSSWQVLPVGAEPKPVDNGVQFTGMIQVPRLARSSYDALFQEYQKQDVPWTCDEEAAVKWILKKQPDFFSHCLPFIGYLQFHFEGPFRGGQRITGFDYRTSWGISGPC